MTDLIEAARMARRRLERFADEANAGRVHYSARELKRKIWTAFAEFDANEKQEETAMRTDILNTDFALVPKEASEAMVQAGLEAAVRGCRERHRTALIPGIDFAVVWRAMIGASQNEVVGGSLGLPVLDGDDGSVDRLGYAANEEVALAVARAHMVDGVKAVDLVERPITLRDGTVVEKAWVAISAENPGARAARDSPHS